MAEQIADNIWVSGKYVDSNVQIGNLDDLSAKMNDSSYFLGMSIHMTESFLSDMGIYYPMDLWSVPSGEDFVWKIKNIPHLENEEDFAVFKAFLIEFKAKIGYFPLANGDTLKVGDQTYVFSSSEDGSQEWSENTGEISQGIIDSIIESGQSYTDTKIEEVKSLLNTTPYVIVDSLPETPSQEQVNKIFLVPSTKASENDIFVEYIWQNGAWEKIGETKQDVDLSSYQTKHDENLTTAEKTVVEAINRVASDVDYVGNTLIPEMNTNTAKALDGKVSWDENKKVISLPMDGSISALRESSPEEGTQPEGGNLLAQRTYDEGVTFVTEVGTTKNKLTLNATERPQVDIQGGASEKMAYLSDIPTLDTEGLKTEIYNSAVTYTDETVGKVASDVDYIGNTLIPEMNANTANALDGKVSWDESKSVISLPYNGSISALREESPEEGTQPEGGNLLCQRTYDSGVTLVTEVGTVKNKLTFNASERPQIDIQGGESKKIAYQSEIVDEANRALSAETELSAAIEAETERATERENEIEEKIGLMVQIPIRTLRDEVYDQPTILGWFGVEDIFALKTAIASGGLMYVKYGISLSYNPHYYKFPVDYCAFESASQIKMVFNGLNTRDDKPARYEVIINLDGTLIDGTNSNVGLSMNSIMTSDDMPEFDAESIKTEVYNSAVTYTDNVVNELVGEDTGKTIREIASEELASQLIPESASASLDTLQEIAEWIQNHPEDAAAMNRQINEISGKVIENTSKIEALEVDSHNHDNKEVLDGITSEMVTSWNAAESNSKEYADGLSSGLNASITSLSASSDNRMDKIATDVDYIGNTLIPEMNTNTAKALDSKVSWDEDKKVISLPMDGSISALRESSPEEGTQPEGGNLLAQRTYDDGATFVTEVGTVKNKLTLNVSERPQIDIQGGKSEKMAYLSDAMGVCANIPIRTLKDEIYPSETILGWFNVDNIPDLKKYISSEKLIWVRYGILLSGNPHYYKFPSEYCAFETANQIKLVFTGLDTSDDEPTRYTIIMNLDGTIIDGSNSNVSLTMDRIAKMSDLTTGATIDTEALKTEIYNSATTYTDGAVKVVTDSVDAEIERATNVENEIKEDVTKLSGDVDHIGNTLIPEMNTNTANALDGKVSWDESKSVISLPYNGSISALREESPEAGTQPEGGNLLCQRTYDSGVTLVTEVGTVKNKLTFNASERPQIDIQGEESKKIAYLIDVETETERALSAETELNTAINTEADRAISAETEINAALSAEVERATEREDEIEGKIGLMVQIPIRTLRDEVYDQPTILGWFGVEDIVSLKREIAYGGLMYVKYGISLSYNPHYYKFPVEYCAFESATQIKMVFNGLNTRDDEPVKYEIIINLDGTVVGDTNSNVSVTMISIAKSDDVSSEVEALSGIVTTLQQEVEALKSQIQTMKTNLTWEVGNDGGEIK